jgi:hypothetical protein
MKSGDHSLQFAGGIVGCHRHIGAFFTSIDEETARVCQAGATALSFEDYRLPDPGGVSRDAVGRSFFNVTTADSAPRFRGSFHRNSSGVKPQ